MVRLTLNNVNKAISELGYSLELVKGEGYFYFIPSKDAVKLYENAVYSMTTTSVDVFKLSDLSFNQWLEEAEAVHNLVSEFVKNEIEADRQKTLILDLDIYDLHDILEKYLIDHLGDVELGHIEFTAKLPKSEDTEKSDRVYLSEEGTAFDLYVEYKRNDTLK